MKLFLVICILMNIYWTDGSPFRGECKKEGVFKKVSSDKALTNHVIATLDVTSGPECTLKCLQHPKCVSYNYQITDLPTKKCELSDQTKTSKPSDYVIKAGYSYHDAEEFVLPVCSASPCLNNGICIDQCTKAYTCKCPHNYIGQNCETWIGFNGTKPEFAGKSCKTIKFVSYRSAPDGKYWIDPTNIGSPFEIICEMTTDGGGWTVVKNLALPDSTPSSNVNGKSNYRLLASFGNWWILEQAGFVSLKNDMGFDQVRYYCRKAKVGRVFHIMTNTNTLGYDAMSYLLFSYTTPYPKACNSFTRLPDDTSVLSRNCAKWGYNNGASLAGRWGSSENIGDQRMYNTMVWMKGHTVIMRGSFQCDDAANDKHSTGDTYKVFVR